jgi:hypothetical protein
VRIGSTHAETWCAKYTLRAIDYATLRYTGRQSGMQHRGVSGQKASAMHDGSAGPFCLVPLSDVLIRWT